mgnify:CR=1 FL=1
MKKTLSALLFVLFVLFSCKSNSIALNITKKVKGNYYLDSRKFLIEKIDTTKGFVVFENIYVPNADYNGCIFQDGLSYCINRKIRNLNNEKTIEEIDEEMVLDINLVKYITNKNIDSLRMIDANMHDNHSYSQLIYYNEGNLNIYVFNSSLRE